MQKLPPSVGSLLHRLDEIEFERYSELVLDKSREVCNILGVIFCRGQITKGGNMKKLFAVLATLALLVVGHFALPAHAQGTGYFAPSATFAFGPGAPCSSITEWNGDPNAYPDEMGAVCLYQGDPYGGPGSFLSAPFQLGFLNNGYLAGCNSLTWQAKVFTKGDGTHVGDTYTQIGATTCPYYTGEYGTFQNSDHRLVGWNVVANFTIVAHRSCTRYGCRTFLSSALTGGTGTVEETLI